MNRELIIGIDPGESGGVSFFFEDGPIVSATPATPRDLLDLFNKTISAKIGRWDSYCPFAYIEKVHSSPQMGVTSAFTFGQGYGALLMLLTCLNIAFEQVTPQKWQKAMGCMSKGDKNVTKRRAQELFPELKITHATADALLIGEYGRRLRVGL